ncbi:MAG: AMP-binding protein [Bacteroidota bacterium]|nr:AMP-binding protein [Bacteroidota bacterium]
MQEFPWLKHYPAGVPKNINPDNYTSLVELFEEACNKYGDQVAFQNMDKGITYNELNKESANFAAYLQNVLKLKKGDRIAIQLPNLLQYPIALFGSLRAGIVVVNTNPLYTPREMEHQFKDSGVEVIVILANFAHNLEKIIKNTVIKTVILTEIGDRLGTLKGFIVNTVVKHVKNMVPDYNLPGAVRFNEVLSKGKNHTYKKPDIKNKDIAFLQYTGGTTGVSKGAILTHRNMVANMEQISAWMVPRLREREEIVITALPLYHIFALTVNCLAMMKIGANNVLVTNPKDLPAFIKELKKHPFSIITGVNTLFNALLNQQAFLDLDFSAMKVSTGGGMAVQKVVALKWQEVTGVPLTEGYGLTETAPVLSCNAIDGTERLGTIGVPLPSTEMTILDDDGNILPVGGIGEVCAKGPQIMPGYWNRPEETAKVFFNEWFKTGDIGMMNEDGFFAIVDRKKDMINVSGFNVYPNEIEDVLAAHPKVLEVAAIGVPDEKSSEAVKVFIVKRDKSLTVEEINSYSKENFTGYKRPKYIEFRDELPKSNVGKILRKNLRDAN